MSSHLPPVEKPRGVMLRVGYWYTRRQFGRVPGPLSVFCARMPTVFMSFYGKVGKLDKKLALAADTVLLIREHVAAINTCAFCMDANRFNATTNAPHLSAKLDELDEYRTSDLFTAAERAALDYVTELTREREVSRKTFAELRRHHTEREICDIVWVAASEHLYNLTNVGLNIGSAGMCEVAARAV